MIYVLVTVPDYEESPKLIFASHNLNSVEKKRNELNELNISIRNIFERIDHEMKIWGAENPYPTYPNLKLLPIMPLVWIGDQCHNQHILKYDEEYNFWHKERSRKYLEISNDIFKNYPEFIKYKHEFGYSESNVDYEIIEVESD